MMTLLLLPPPPETKSSKKKVLVFIGLSILALVIGLSAYLTYSSLVFSYSSTQSSRGIKQVIVKVEYQGDWEGAYGDSSSIISWNGYGTKSVTLNRPLETYIWIVSGNAQKKDDSNKVLKISILTLDGKILKTASTDAPYGVAQISYSFV